MIKHYNFITDGPYDTTLTYGSTTLKPSDKIQKRIGEALSVNCMSDCNPACNISWYKDGKMLSLHTQFNLPDLQESDGKMLSYNSQLNLPDLQESDDGVYTCKVYNIHATTNISFTLDLKYGPYNTTLTYGSTTLKPDYAIQKRIGEALSVNCMSDCNPACKISWYKDGKMLSYNSQLSLPDLQESDDGVYTCTVYNIHATTNISFTLDLKYGPYNTTLTYGSTTLKPDYAIQKRIGEALSVNCMSDCNPACNISWYKDGKMLSLHTQLNLPNLQESDDGVYTCTLFNIHGITNISFSLSTKAMKTTANEGNQPFIIILGLSIGVVLLVIIVSVLIVVFICMKIRNVSGGYTKSKKRRKKKKSSAQKVYPGWRTNENQRDDDERLFEAIELHRGAALADTKRNFANFKLREAHNNIEELIYADLDLPLCNNNIIHGQKYKIIYGVIDFNKVPPPRPCGYVSEEDSSSSSSS
ncbi:hypothetical protein SNE40_016308 [Patella caerulea]|uniref:Ig-like domain-containing protein n=1 Tax=Patella caerulea TaxID=87958 RepID=A0AAN8JCX3_PATCE